MQNTKTDEKVILVTSDEAAKFDERAARWAGCTQHRFYLLTKQPQNLHKWIFPENCWVGVTVCNQEMADEYIPHLLRVDAAVRFVSIEPMLGPIDLEKNISEHALIKPIAFLDLIIIGSQTKPTVMPRIEWVSEIVQAADRAGVKVFLKDSLLLKTLPVVAPYWTGLSGLSDEHLTAKYRQEMP